MLKGSGPFSGPFDPAGKGVPTRILGVDPGMVSTGFGLIEIVNNGSILYRECGVIRPRGLSIPKRLQKIFRGLVQLIETFSPQYMAVERPFFGKNVKSAMTLGQARGAALLAAAETGLEVQEFSPLEVKQAVSGYGRATKEQIQSMVRVLLRVPRELTADPADALAVALCLAHCLPLKNSLPGGDWRTLGRGKRRLTRRRARELGNSP